MGRASSNCAAVGCLRVAVTSGMPDDAAVYDTFAAG